LMKSRILDFERLIYTWRGRYEVIERSNVHAVTGGTVLAGDPSSSLMDWWSTEMWSSNEGCLLPHQNRRRWDQEPVSVAVLFSNPVNTGKEGTKVFILLHAAPRGGSGLDPPCPEVLRRRSSSVRCFVCFMHREWIYKGPERNTPEWVPHFM
jgi:hypothetical protein